MPLTRGHIYLVKANDELLSQCACGDGRITFPPQMDCPWCGCGWLFTCVQCRKAFAFAKGVVVEESWEQTAACDLRGRWNKEPERKEVGDWVGAMRELLADVVPGTEYVCLDGRLIPTSETSAAFDGWHSQHDLPYVPQVAALSDPSVLQSVLAQPRVLAITRNAGRRSITSRCCRPARVAGPATE